MSVVHDHASAHRPDELRIAPGPLEWCSPNRGFGAPDGVYGRRCWLPVIGPSAWAMWTTLAHQLTGTTLQPVVRLSRTKLTAALGLGRIARTNRALARLEWFYLAVQRDLVWEITTACPPVSEHRLSDLDADTIRFHHDLIDSLNTADLERLRWLFPNTATAHEQRRRTP